MKTYKYYIVYSLVNNEGKAIKGTMITTLNKKLNTAQAIADVTKSIAIDYNLSEEKGVILEFIYPLKK